MKKNIAVLLYGQSRDINNPIPINSIKFLLPKYNLDFYIHTWNDPLYEAQKNIVHKKFTPKAIQVDQPLDREETLNKYELQFTECENRLGISKSDSYKYSIISQLASVQAVNELFCKTANIMSYDYIVMTRTDVIALGKINESLLDKFDLLVSSHHSYYPDVIQVYKPSIAKKIRPLLHINETFKKTWDISGESFRETTFCMAGIKITYDKFDYRLVRNGINIDLAIKLMRQMIRYYLKKMALMTQKN